MSAANLDMFPASLSGVTMDFGILRKRVELLRTKCRAPWPAIDEVLRRLDDLDLALEQAMESAP